jgi:hypothetical protein
MPVAVGFAVVPEPTRLLVSSGLPWQRWAAPSSRPGSTTPEWTCTQMSSVADRAGQPGLGGRLGAPHPAAPRPADVRIGAAMPIRICKNGWPTGPGRPEDRQAEVLDTVLRAVHARRHELNITHWESLCSATCTAARRDRRRAGPVKSSPMPGTADQRPGRSAAGNRAGPGWPCGCPAEWQAGLLGEPFDVTAAHPRRARPGQRHPAGPRRG